MANWKRSTRNKLTRAHNAAKVPQRPRKGQPAAHEETDAEYEARVRAEADARLRDIWGKEWDEMPQAQKDADWELARDLYL